MHESTNQLPAKIEADGTNLRAVDGWGGMAVAYIELPTGTDLGPMLKGLPGDGCTCHHWGYVVKGKITVGNADGSKEGLSAGDVFHLTPGHTAKVDQDVAFVEFSPEREFKETLCHLLQKGSPAK